MKHLSKFALYKIGKFDNGGRYYLDDEFQTDTSAYVRSPSRAWNLSLWKHAKTAKYLKSLSKEQLDKILDLCNHNESLMYEE